MVGLARGVCRSVGESLYREPLNIRCKRSENAAEMTLETCAAYYRGAMGILLVYDVTDEASFNNVRNWMKNIETHASSTVNKVGLSVVFNEH